MEDCLTRIGGCDTQISVIYGADNTLRYRNKVQFPISKNAIGFYGKRTHQVTDVEDCLLQPLPAAQFLVDPQYDALQSRLDGAEGGHQFFFMGEGFTIDQHAAQAFPSPVGADVEVAEESAACFFVVGRDLMG